MASHNQIQKDKYKREYQPLNKVRHQYRILNKEKYKVIERTLLFKWIYVCYRILIKRNTLMKYIFIIKYEI
ncbi:unnamed protein product [Paramecium sonneborni]|uniref:Uncharacterized protein n=1 Tax=Paramecium sonneborni TaxID=65129 RepID=A0A8S1NMC4_9CILI|nr:unnamed protein product [Paramecium sonneborni]